MFVLEREKNELDFNTIPICAQQNTFPILSYSYFNEDNKTMSTPRGYQCILCEIKKGKNCIFYYFFSH